MGKIIAVIVGVVLLALGINIALDFINGSDVTRAYFDERISAVETKTDSLIKKVEGIDLKVSALQRETDTIKHTTRDNGRKLDEIKTELDEVKTTTQNIQFRLF